MRPIYHARPTASAAVVFFGQWRTGHWGIWDVRWSGGPVGEAKKRFENRWNLKKWFLKNVMKCLKRSSEILTEARTGFGFEIKSAPDVDAWIELTVSRKWMPTDFSSSQLLEV